MTIDSVSSRSDLAAHNDVNPAQPGVPSDPPAGTKNGEAANGSAVKPGFFGKSPGSDAASNSGAYAGSYVGLAPVLPRDGAPFFSASVLQAEAPPALQTPGMDRQAAVQGPAASSQFNPPPISPLILPSPISTPLAG
jgi:hypothetical protein